MKKNFYALLILCISTRASALAQPAYNGGESMLGVRLGGAAGVTYKKFIDRWLAFEFLGSYGFDPNIKSISLTGLVEKHVPVVGDRLCAMIGVGPSYIFKDSRGGVAGTLGFDWRMDRVPLNLQADWLPGYFFINDNRLTASNVAVSIRYVLNHRRIYNTGINRTPRREPPPPPARPTQQLPPAAADR